MKGLNDRVVRMQLHANEIGVGCHHRRRTGRTILTKTVRAIRRSERQQWRKGAAEEVADLVAERAERGFDLSLAHEYEVRAQAEDLYPYCLELHEPPFDPPYDDLDDYVDPDLLVRPRFFPCLRRLDFT